MKEKFIIILSSLLLFGCQNEEKFIWEAAMSRPAYYVFTGPHLFYLRNGEIIGSSATLTDIDGSWSKWNSSRSANYSGMMPDSVVVDYYGLNQKLETCHYRGGMSLPTQELEAMFRSGYIDEKGEAKKHERIITGMAPGGRICVWVDHIEIKRGIVGQGEIYSDHPIVFFGDSIEINNYLKYHPVDYTIWEKPDPRYELDFGFCSENNLTHFNFIYYISKEGIRNVVFKEQIDLTSWDIPYGKESNLMAKSYIQKGEEFSLIKKQLPVEVQIGWGPNSQSYYTHVVLPKNFNKQFTQSYLNPITGLKTYFNRLVFGVENDGKHCVVWLDGPEKQKKIMRFKGSLSMKDENGVYLNKGGYATEVEYFDPE